jgi:two-component system, cell cycle sensor histidine kinase and response regulator CckA
VTFASVTVVLTSFALLGLAGSIIWMLARARRRLHLLNEQLRQDVQARARAEQALRDSEARFRTLIDGAPDGVIVQRHGMVSFVNPEMARLLGADGPDAIIGTPLSGFLAPEYRAWASERARLRGTGARTPAGEVEFLRLDGSRFVGSAKAVAFRYEGEDGDLIFVRDVTAEHAVEAERRTLEAELIQSQKMESIGRLAAGVAHDFNNIITVLRGYCQVLRHRARPESMVQEAIDEIAACTDRAASLTAQLLSFGRRQTLQPRVIDLNALVEHLAGLLRALIGEDVALVWRPAPGPLTVRADPAQLELVLMNLATNARDAMPQGGTLTLALTVADADPAAGRPGRQAVLRVTDTGCGMDETTRKQVFEPFFTTKALGKGTGLGLAMAYGIVTQSGGTIAVASEPDNGSVFTVALPLVDAVVEEPAMLAEVQAPGGTESVLIVEDDRALRRATTVVLEALGYWPVEADGGVSALQLIDGQGVRPDVLLVDIVMPGMGGVTFVEQARSRLPGVRVLFMSGYTDHALDEPGVLDSRTRFLPKPFAVPDLASALRAVIDSA